MAIIGFIVLVLFALGLLVCAYCVGMMEMFMSNKFPVVGSVITAASVGILWCAFHFAPFTISFNVT